MNNFNQRLKKLIKAQKEILNKKNKPIGINNGIIQRYQYPVLTADHTPIFWRYDLNPQTNPLLIERLGMNVVFNPGAILWNNEVYLVCRAEGVDRKSFFALAKSKDGINHFQFLDYPILLPETEDPDINVYDMRLIQHEDEWIYGIFCTERKDKAVPASDTSSAIAKAGIVRTKDLQNWERLPDLITKSPQQRNVVLHPEFIEGKYALYTRPQDGFIETGTGGGICWGLCSTMEKAVVENEIVIDERVYHTIKESKNGQGPAPIKTAKGWIHIAHGVRNTAAGLRYVLYAFLTDLKDPKRIIASPGGYLLAPSDEERIGDVSNVLFCNGAVCINGDRVLIYYASSDTRIHVGESSVERLLDYLLNTPSDGLRSYACVQTRNELIRKNLRFMDEHPKYRKAKI